MSKEMEVNSSASGGPDFSSLPEGCIADVLALTSPRDACIMPAVAPSFLFAAESDALWEKFLPTDYLEIMAISSDPSSLQQFSSKKELYMSLCDSPVMIDGGTKMFWLEKRSGKKCCMWGPREVSVSRFAEVTRLCSVSLSEIKVKLNTSILSPNTIYAAYLVYQMEHLCCGLKYYPFVSSIEVIGKEASKRLPCPAAQRRQRRENDHTNQSATSGLCKEMVWLRCSSARFSSWEVKIWSWR